MPTYWCGSRRRRSTPPTATVVQTAVHNIEPVPTEMEDRAKVKIRNLTKTFDTPTGTKVAVNGLNLDLYEGQIFALLGHNGAGKTTTINMLSGMLPISSGEATVLGLDVETEVS
jgi:ABC-type sugar transport system ATPase subunit